jgi:hypothetical protein
MARPNTHAQKPAARETRPSRLWSLWHLLFSVDNKFITWQQRRHWRARALFFFLLGVILTLAVQAGLGRFGLCPK